jgi:hypothetical protein
MQTREAVEILSERARSVGAKLNALAGLAVFVSFAIAFTAVESVGWPHVSRFWTGLSTAVAGGVAFGVVLPVARGLVKRAIGLRRQRWIEELAGCEGLNAEELAKYFTLDSW